MFKNIPIVARVSLSLSSVFPVGDADLHPGNSRKSITSVGTHLVSFFPDAEVNAEGSSTYRSFATKLSRQKENWCPPWWTFGLAAALFAKTARGKLKVNYPSPKLESEIAFLLSLVT